MKLINMIKLYSDEFLKNNKYLIFLYFILTISYYFVEVGGITYIISNLNSINKNIVIISIVILSSLVILNYIKGVTENKISSGINSYSRQKILNGIIERYKESYTDIKIGNVISRVFSATLEFRFGFILFMKVIFPTFLVLLITSSVIFKLNKSIGILLFVCIIITILLSFIGYKKVSNKKINQELVFYNNFDNLVNKYNNLMNSYINNETDKDKQNTTERETNYGSKLLDADNEMIRNTTFLRLNLCVFIFIIIYCIYIKKIKINNNTTIIGLLLIYFFNNYLVFSSDTSPFFSHLGICYGSYGFFNKMFLVQKDKKNKYMKNGSIEIKNLTFSYEKNHKIFDKLSLDIGDGEKVAIIGRSGSGKTTFAKIILKLYNYDGIVKVGGVNIQKINTNFLREQIIYINQKTILLDTTVIENIQYGNDISKDAINIFLDKYNLKDIFSGLKNGVNEICSTGGNNLSLGMQKIIILVRGVIKCKKSKIIFFDEPLAGLDQTSRNKVINMIFKECKGKTIIIITHDKEIIPYMDKVKTLNNNKIESFI